MKDPQTTVPQSPQAPSKRAYTTPEEHQRYLVMKENAREYVLKEGNPEGVVFKVIEVTPELQNVSFDRGESTDKFYVLKYRKDAQGKLTPAIDATDPASGAFFEYCKDFCEKYKVATS